MLLYLTYTWMTSEKEEVRRVKADEFSILYTNVQTNLFLRLQSKPKEYAHTRVADEEGVHRTHTRGLPTTKKKKTRHSTKRSSVVFPLPDNIPVHMEAGRIRFYNKNEKMTLKMETDADEWIELCGWRVSTAYVWITKS